MGGIRGALVFCPECDCRMAVVSSLIVEHFYYKTKAQNAKPYRCKGSGMIVDINFYPANFAK